MSLERNGADVIPRRKFLSHMSLTLSGSALVANALSPRRVEATESSPLLPTIRLGDHEVTRLIAGSNPIHGYSYLGPIMDRHMREYFTPERIVEFLSDCERAGINTHQFSDPKQMTGIIRTLRERGSKMKFICLHSGGSENASV